MLTQKLQDSSNSEFNEDTQFSTVSNFERRRLLLPKVKAIFYAKGYAILQGTFSVGLKWILFQGMTLLDVMVARFFISAIVDFIVMKINKKQIIQELNTPEKKCQALLRGVIFQVSFLTFLWGLSLIQTVFVTLIQNTSVGIAALLGFFIFGDVLYCSEVIALLTGYSGIVLIILGNPSTDQESQTPDQQKFVFGILATFTNACFLAAILINSRKLREVHFSVVQFTADGFCAILTSLFYLFIHYKNEQIVTLTTYPSHLILILVGVCVANSLSMQFHTLASQLEKAGVVGVIFYSQLLYNFVGDVWLFKVVFSALQLVGAGLVLGANAFIVCTKTRKPQ